MSNHNKQQTKTLTLQDIRATALWRKDAAAVRIEAVGDDGVVYSMIVDSRQAAGLAENIAGHVHVAEYEMLAAQKSDKEFLDSFREFTSKEWKNYRGAAPTPPGVPDLNALFSGLPESISEEATGTDR